MIHLHPGLLEDLIRFLSPEEIYARPNYLRDVDPNKVKLVKPVGVYRFREEIACGLKNCHQPHFKGLVALTSDNNEVNIGHYCGRKHFGDTFEVFSNIAQRFESRHAHIKQVRELKSVGLRYLTRIDELIPAAQWIRRAVEGIIASVPSDALQSLSELAQRGNTEVFDEARVEGADAELHRQFDVRSAWGRSAHDEVYRQVSRGHIVGIAIWRDDPLHYLNALRDQLSAVLTLDPFTCHRRRLREAADMAAQLDSRMQRLEFLARAGQEFFSVENMQRLQYLPRVHQSTRDLLRSLKWDESTKTFRKNRAA